MKKKNKLFSLGLAAVMSLGILAGCGATEQESPGVDENNNTAGAGEEKVTLVMGTSADYPPFEYIDTAVSDEIIGFDVDLAKYITEKLGYEFEIKDMDFNSLVPALSGERVDFVLAGMTPTPERLENVDFSDIYFEANNLIVTKADSGIESIEDLAGNKVGVQLGSIQEGEAEGYMEEVGEFELEKRNRIPELIQELKSNRIDAAIIEDTVAKGFIESNEDLVGFIIPNEEQAGSAIGFPKNSELKDEFNAVLQEMKEDGTLDELILKWFAE